MDITKDKFKEHLENLMKETGSHKDGLMWLINNEKNWPSIIKNLVYILFLKNINSQTTQNRKSFNYLKEYVGELERVGWVTFKI